MKNPPQSAVTEALRNDNLSTCLSGQGEVPSGLHLTDVRLARLTLRFVAPCGADNTTGQLFLIEAGAAEAIGCVLNGNLRPFACFPPLLQIFIAVFPSPFEGPQFDLPPS